VRTKGPQGLQGRTICKRDDENDNRKYPIKLDRKQDKRDYDIGKCRDDIEYHELSGKVST